MSLSEAYESLDDIPFPSCKTCRWYDNLPPGDKAFFDDKVTQMDQDGTGRGKLLRACKGSGLDVAASSFRTHILSHHEIVRGEQR